MKSVKARDILLTKINLNVIFVFTIIYNEVNDQLPVGKKYWSACFYCTNENFSCSDLFNNEPNMDTCHEISAFRPTWYGTIFFWLAPTFLLKSNDSAHYNNLIHAFFEYHIYLKLQTRAYQSTRAKHVRTLSPAAQRREKPKDNVVRCMKNTMSGIFYFKT